MKIFVFNLNVGSGIQYIGDEFISIINGLNRGHVRIETRQTCFQDYIVELSKFKPDYIVANEMYRRVSEAIFAYKTFNPEVKILVVSHLANAIMGNMSPDVSGLVSVADKMINVGSARKTNMENIDLMYPPVDPNKFSKKTPWRSRKLACFVGRVISQKISVGFAKAYFGPKIDVYGRAPGADQDLVSMLDKNESFCLNDCVAHDAVSDVFNNYKFSVFPVSGPEVWCLSMLESMMCGTIPIVINSAPEDRRDWSSWAKGMIYEYRGDPEPGARLVADLLAGCQGLLDDLDGRSDFISKNSIEKFRYSSIKEKVSDFIL